MTYLLSTLNLYFCRVFFTWFISCTVVIGTVISLFEGSELIRRSIGKTTVTLPLISEMIILKLPGHFQTLLPFIILSATMVTLYRLNSTHQIVAARSVGLSIWQFLGGLISFVLLLGCLQLAILNPLSSAMSNRLANLDAFYFSRSSNRLAISETGVWLKEITPDRQSIIHTNHVQPETKIFSTITFHNFLPDGRYESRINAASAKLANGFWELQDVTVWEAKGGKGSPHATMKLSTSLTLEKIQDSTTSPENISFWSLPKFINILDRSGLSSISYRLHWHSQIAKIGMMIAMILLAAAFGIRPVRQGKTFLYIALGVGSGFALYFLNDVIYALGLGNQIPIFLAAWTPTFVMALLSLTLVLHLEDG